MIKTAPSVSKWKKIKQAALVLIAVSCLLATITAGLLVMRPSWLLLVCFIAQVAIAIVQLKILKVCRLYVQ